MSEILFLVYNKIIIRISRGEKMNYYPPQANYQQPYMPQQNRFGGYPGYGGYANQIPMDKVQGIDGAKRYPMAANSSVLLFDTENDGIVYIKISNALGECSSLRTFVEPIPQVQPAPTTQSLDMSNFVSRDEFNALKALIEERSANNGKQSVSANNEQSAAATAVGS